VMTLETLLRRKLIVPSLALVIALASACSSPNRLPDCRSNSEYCETAEEECQPNASLICHENNVYAQDSCENIGNILQSCISSEQCQEGQCLPLERSCIPNYNRICNEGNPTWIDSCGNLGEIISNCTENETCLDGNCVLIEEPCIEEMGRICMDNISYWVNSCGELGEPAEYCTEGCDTGFCHASETRCYEERVWQTEAPHERLTYAEAQEYCHNLSLDGLTAWRIPNISELRMLIQDCSPTITGGSCPVTNDCLSQNECYSSDCQQGCGEDSAYYDPSHGWYIGTGWLGGGFDGRWWTSSSVESEAVGNVYIIAFYNGVIGIENTEDDTQHNIRCIEEEVCE